MLIIEMKEKGKQNRGKNWKMGVRKRKKTNKRKRKNPTAE